VTTPAAARRFVGGAARVGEPIRWRSNGRASHHRTLTNAIVHVGCKSELFIRAPRVVAGGRSPTRTIVCPHGAPTRRPEGRGLVIVQRPRLRWGLRSDRQREDRLVRLSPLSNRECTDATHLVAAGTAPTLDRQLRRQRRTHRGRPPSVQRGWSQIRRSGCRGNLVEGHRGGAGDARIR